MQAGSVWKWTSLIAFCLQNTCTPIIFRYATTESSSSARASTSAIIFFTEFMKLVMSFFLLSVEEGFSLVKAGGVVWEDWVKKPRESLSLGIPALVYGLQNALLQWSAGDLSAAIWQVTYQGKILVTAAFSVVLLRKQIKRVQWLAITIMGSGIAIVQLSDAKESKQDSMANAAEQNAVRGFIMLVLAASCSGFASVFTEMVFKQVGAAANQKKKSVWLQNMQLASFTVLLMLWGYAMENIFPKEGEGGQQRSFMYGMTAKVWMLILNNSIGGLLVALVIKHADNILRGFASAIATINVALVSVVTFGFMLKPSFAVGTFMVIGSTLLYGNVLKLPGEWWNSEFALCSGSRLKDYKNVHASETEGNGGNTPEVPSAVDPEAGSPTKNIELPNVIGSRMESKA